MPPPTVPALLLKEAPAWLASRFFCSEGVHVHGGGALWSSAGGCCRPASLFRMHSAFTLRTGWVYQEVVRPAVFASQQVRVSVYVYHYFHCSRWQMSAGS
jgi:hypothetical protein